MNALVDLLSSASDLEVAEGSTEAIERPATIVTSDDSAVVAATATTCRRQPPPGAIDVAVGWWATGGGGEWRLQIAMRRHIDQTSQFASLGSSTCTRPRLATSAFSCLEICVSRLLARSLRSDSNRNEQPTTMVAASAHVRRVVGCGFRGASERGGGERMMRTSKSGRVFSRLHVRRDDNGGSNLIARRCDSSRVVDVLQQAVATVDDEDDDDRGSTLDAHRIRRDARWM